MNEKPASKRGWRILRRSLIGLAIFATLVAIFYTEENWRGKRAWEKCKAELEAKGAVLDWNAYIPPPVPDEQNFFMAAIFAGLSNEPWEESAQIRSRGFINLTVALEQRTNLLDRLKMSIYGNNDLAAWPSVGYWVKGTNTDLGAWQQYYRALATKTNDFPVAPQPQTPAADVLLALSKYNSVIEELRHAGQRPDSRLPLDYGNSIQAALQMLPLLADFKSCAVVLQLRAIAELQNGESGKALDDIKLMLRLNDSLRNEPFQISDLVRIAMASITLQPIYEGLAKHQWTDSQLAELEQALAKLDFLADFQFLQRGEQARAIALVDYFRQNRRELVRLVFSYTGSVDNKSTYLSRAVGIGFYLMPGGWLYQNELALGQQHQRWDSRMVDTKQRTVSPETIKQAGETIGVWRARPWNFIAREYLTARSGTAMKTVRTQVEVDLARTACALERYRLAHGEYPETLDALVPQFIEKLPHDIIGGGPLHYRRASGGSFVLYSIGWNEKDDGGVFSYPPGSSLPRFEQGDWVWQYPAK